MFWHCLATVYWCCSSIHALAVLLHIVNPLNQMIEYWMRDHIIVGLLLSVQHLMLDAAIQFKPSSLCLFSV
jgi:hypothetical protein